MTERYSEDGQLSLLANEIAHATDLLKDATKFRWKIIFVNSPLGDNEIAGKCKKLEGAVRYLWEHDYLILIYRQQFDASTIIDKARVIIHELYHIQAGEKGEPSIRRHNADFCSIPEHDQIPYTLSRKIYKELKHLAQFETQKQIEVSVKV